MRSLMAHVGQAGPGILSKIPGIGKMFGGGVPGMPGSLPPEALEGLVPAPNRRAARAQKAQQKRQNRQQQRKQQRRQKPKQKRKKR